MSAFVGMIVVVLFFPITLLGFILMVAIEGFGTSFSFV